MGGREFIELNRPAIATVFKSSVLGYYGFGVSSIEDTQSISHTSDCPVVGMGITVFILDVSEGNPDGSGGDKPL